MKIRMFIWALLLLPALGFSATMELDSLPLPEFMEQNYPDAQEVVEGVYFNIEEEGTGAVPDAGDYLVVDFVGSRLDGAVFDKSGEEPFIFQLGRRQVINGWERSLGLFKVGSKVTLLLSPDWAYGSEGAGKMVPGDTPVKFEINIQNILSEDEYDKYMIALEEKERKAYQARVESQFEEDKKNIHEYCMANKIKAKRTTSGVSYSVEKKGKGEYPKAGDVLTVEYEGFLVDGTSFDKSNEKEPFVFPLGRGKVIKGWEEALPFFNKGSSGKIVIPSKYAYGQMGIEEESINIPPNSILIFQIKVIDISSPESE